MASIIFIIGVAGSGKTTIGHLVASAMGIPFYDGDDFHSKENKHKMASGNPLNDQDRLPWLKAINQKAIEASLNNGAVIACSALKNQYRSILANEIKYVHWIFLEGNYDTIHQRLLQRNDHYLKASLLQSQFDILEEPANAFSLSVNQAPEKMVESIIQHISLNQLGIIGMGVMGKSLAMNFGGKGIRLSLYNRFVKGKEEGIAQLAIDQNPSLSNAQAFESLEAFVHSLSVPRTILLMINAGEAIDQTLDLLKPLLDKNDLVIDGGNTHFLDTARRVKEMNNKGVHFMGAGVSGGEEGALKGPSIMVGGDMNQFLRIKSLFELIAAKDKNGQSCMGYIGAGGSGHFVKMVHNGIEYAEMQLIAEVYYILRKLNGETPATIAAIFEQWNKGEGSSYLLEITIEILRKKSGDHFLIDDILDIGASKGTGSWATQTAAELGTAAGMMTTALFERFQSSENADKKSRHTMNWPKGNEATMVLRNQFGDNYIELIGAAFQLARIVNHHQGFSMINAASKQYQWSIDQKAVASIWVSGCIIRSVLMEELAAHLEPGTSILDMPFYKDFIEKHQIALAKLVGMAINNGLSVPALGAAIQFINGYFSEDSPMNIIQAQRDYFGAHKVVLKSDPQQNQVHIPWK